MEVMEIQVNGGIDVMDVVYEGVMCKGMNINRS